MPNKSARSYAKATNEGQKQGDRVEISTIVPDSIESFELTVQGVPIPQGSKKGFARGRKVNIVDSNKATLKPWRAHVCHEAAKALAGRTGFDSAVYVLLDFYMPRPKTVLRLRPHVKPDIDKLTRAIFDSLTDARVLKDDSLVVSVHAQKWYADDGPYVRIKVGALA